MKSCWAYHPDDRPNFDKLSSLVDTELATFADYVDLSMFADDNTALGSSEE